MSSSVFKTPASSTYKRTKKYTTTPLSRPFHSDKEDSQSACSTDSEETSSEASSDQLSITAEFDELTRFTRFLKSERSYIERSYSEYVEKSMVLAKNFKKSQEECRSLQEKLDAMANDNSDLESKLLLARKLLDKEKKKVKVVEQERNNLEMQIVQVKELFMRDKRAPYDSNAIPEDTLSKLGFLSSDKIENERPPYLSCIPEVNSTGSILSDLSYSRSDNDLDSSDVKSYKVWKSHRPSGGGVADPPVKKRRSSGKIVEISTTDTVRATTTLSMPKNGPITATSIIEALPSAPPLNEVYAPSAPPESPHLDFKKHQEHAKILSDVILNSWGRNNKNEAPVKPSRSNFEKNNEFAPETYNNNNNNNNNCYMQKQHSFQKKTIMLPEICNVCQKKLRFSRIAWKCKDCKNICHEECKANLLLPCIPVIHTPTQKNGLGVIGDYTGTRPPMVPPLIMHCINEIESREQKEIGLYRVSASEKDVKMLKERFLKGKAAPCLNDIDIHVLCGVIKDFLKSLSEPLVTKMYWKHFISASEKGDIQTIKDKILELPQSNRDTLAYLMLHLRRIAELSEIKMPVDNLAKVFGLTVVGYSAEDMDREQLLTETRKQLDLMRDFLALPTSFWESFLAVNNAYCGNSNRLQQTPSTDSLLRKTPKSQIGATKRRRFFPTPPDARC